MKYLKTLLIPALAILVMACGPSSSKMNKEIKETEAILYDQSSNGFNVALADSLLTMYKKYIDKFPSDSLTVKYTFNAASLAMNLQKGGDAIALFDRFLTNYPQDPRTHICMFFKAFIYENQLQDLDKAKEVYLAFLEKYPESDFADDAKSSLENLGKSPEEMVAEFEKRQKEDSASAAQARK